MSGPPRHVHSREDELFYVLEGEIVFELDGTRHTVRPGGTVYLRRGVVHAYQNFTTVTRSAPHCHDPWRIQRLVRRTVGCDAAR